MSFFTYDPNDPEDKPDNNTGAWLTGIAWLIVVVIFFLGLGALFAHIAGG